MKETKEEVLNKIEKSMLREGIDYFSLAQKEAVYRAMEIYARQAFLYARAVKPTSEYGMPRISGNVTYSFDDFDVFEKYLKEL